MILLIASGVPPDSPSNGKLINDSSNRGTLDDGPYKVPIPVMATAITTSDNELPCHLDGNLKPRTVMPTCTLLKLRTCRATSLESLISQ